MFGMFIEHLLSVKRLGTGITVNPARENLEPSAELL